MSLQNGWREAARPARVLAHLLRCTVRPLVGPPRQATRSLREAAGLVRDRLDLVTPAASAGSSA